MNLYNNEDESKGGAPLAARGGVPFKKSSLFGKTPMLSRAAGGIMDRLKNLSRKDMAFVGLGLSVLVMAPVAEYVMSKPSADNLLAPGFGSRDGSAMAGLYEPGINALSQGSADGSGEIITPLSSRDPASLILGSQPAQPPVMSAPPPDMSMRDAMKDSGRAAFSAAAQSSGAPTPIPKMQAALRGVSSFFGGGEGSRTAGVLNGKAIIDDAKSASSKAVKRSMVGPVAMPGYKGVASNTPNSASKSALEKLRLQADKAASNFGGESAIGSLDKAAADSVNVGKGDGGFGAGGDGEKGKSASNSNNKNSHSSSGESLAQMAAKQRQAKALEWEFYKKYEIPKQILSAAITGATGSLTKFTEKLMNKLTGQGSGPATIYICVQKVDEAKGCLKGNLQGTIRTTEEKTVDSWVKNGTCKCGPMTPDELTANNGGPEADVTPNPGGTTTVVVPSSVTASANVRETFAGYDTALVKMLEDVKAGVEGWTFNSGSKLLDHTISLAGGFQNLRTDGVVNAITNNTATSLGGPVADLERTIIDASRTVSLQRAQYTMFRAKFDRIKRAALNNTLVAEGVAQSNGISASGDLANSIRPYLAQVEPELDYHVETYLVKAETDIALSRSALSAYRAQGRHVSAKARPVGEAYAGTVLRAALAEHAKLTQLKTALNGANPNDEQKGVIAASFKLLSGRDADLAQNKTAAAPGLINKALLWRGVDASTPIEKGALNDGAAINKEVADWKAVTPLAKAVVVETDNLPAGSLLAAAIRGGVEIRDDAKDNAKLPVAATGKYKPLEDKMGTIKTELKALGVDMDKINTGAPVTDPVVDPPADPGIVVTEAELNNAYSSVFAEYNGTEGKVARAQGAYSALPLPSAVAQGEHRTEYIKQQGVARDKLGALNTAWTDFKALQARISATTDPVQRKALLAEINTAKERLNQAYTQYDTAVKSAAAYAAAHPASSYVTPIETLKAQAQTAYDRVAAAYRGGNTSMSGFPSGTAARDEKKRQARAKMNDLSVLYTDSRALNVTAQKAGTARDSVITAKNSLQRKAVTAEGLAVVIANLRNEANGLLSGKCWENASGCATLSPFYMERKWQVRQQRLTMWIIYAEADGAEGQAWDWAYANRTGSYTTAQLNEVCNSAWDADNWFEKARLAVRSWVNGGVSRADRIKTCKEKWFVPKFEIKHTSSRIIQDSGDLTSFTGIAPAGSATSLTQRTFQSGTQERGGRALKVWCAPKAGVWEVTSVSFWVDAIISNTYSQGVNMSVGPSVFKVGMATTVGQNATANMGSWTAIQGMAGKACGGVQDNN
ncbi:MAG: hypothetical protein A2234_02090 [Elusimicrobia bacterium RIFOXYA2_FULL_58_8]|nr:MAG: hypothetical protein A2285_01805 [Elusimicrobia bacterium RIFOXYA12_FULL_57_11]OGS17388.1 MAG: hypothetical protein A2234_02090 [Elusimicrobia bacterium RIFOXYA2_FULL_58_8]